MTLLHVPVLEDWKEAIDSNHRVAAIFMDMPKAFYCLDHNIFLSKPSAYGMSGDAVKLMTSYLYGRKQQMKIGIVISSFSFHCGL